MGETDRKKLITFLQWNRKTGGDDLDWVAQGAAARGKATPAVVRTKPVLQPDAVFYWFAYLDLMDADWASCEKYARCYNVDVQFLWSVIVQMRAAGSEKPK